MTKAKRQLQAKAIIAQATATIRQRQDRQLAHARANYATNLKVVSLLAEHCRSVLEEGGSGDAVGIVDDVLLDAEELARLADEMGLLDEETKEDNEDRGAR